MCLGIATAWKPGAATNSLAAFMASVSAVPSSARACLTGQRRPHVRFYACEEDLSHESPDAPLPEVVAEGREPYLVIGAMAGG